MTIEERKIQVKQAAQKLVLENRETLSVSGVKDVESFSETAVNLDTNMGRLAVKGENLKINKLNVDTGDLSLIGKINAMEFVKGAKRVKGNFIEHLFK